MLYPDVAVLIPCHDEGATVADVVEGFRRHLPGARIVVCDNASSDDTAARARAAGAAVIHERRRGKGFAVRRLFSDVEAGYYLLVDGDATYDPASAPRMVHLMRHEGVDTVLGVRRHAGGGSAEYRTGHQLGNALFSRAFSSLFETSYTDVLTGYRGFSRRFVKSCPLLARGFDVEIELNAHGASLALPYAEIDTRYVERPSGSHSKLNTYADGTRIMRRLLRLHRDFRPFAVLGAPGAVLGLVGLALFAPILLEFRATGLVPRFPTLIAIVGMVLAGLVMLLVGTILERAARDRIERNRLFYLAQPPPGALTVIDVTAVSHAPLGVAPLDPAPVTASATAPPGRAPA